MTYIRIILLETLRHELHPRLKEERAVLGPIHERLGDRRFNHEVEMVRSNAVQLVQLFMVL